MTIDVKKFDDFTISELYEILQLRSEVFVVEQHCVYQDLDGKDKVALHVIGTHEGQVVAYTRIFKQGDYADEANIGRVVVRNSKRKYGYGEAIMKASIAAVKTYFNETAVHLSAQTYLVKFYNSLGFLEVGEEYLEDGIPHIKMARK